jgi:hypothetical protein
MPRSLPTRRSIVQGLAAGALTLPLLPRFARAAGTPRETPALVIVYLNGGPAGLFNNAASFLSKGSFGVTHDNVRSVGDHFLIDKATLGSLPETALAHMASINFQHGFYNHELARAALLQTGDRSNLLLLAQAMPTPAPIRCAIVNSLGFPAGVDQHPPAENDISVERVIDLRAIGHFDQPSAPTIAHLADAYGVTHDAGAIGDARTSFLAAELLLSAGTNVVFMQPMFSGRPDRQLDTHDDTTGVKARDLMATIMAPLRTFASRALALAGRNVVIVLTGEFSRTIATSDHETGGTATVIGKYVKTGIAAPLTAEGAPPPGTAPVAGLWSYVANVLRLADHPFGANPNPELVIAADAKA